ncbi:metallophosphoesterase [Gracilibacillus oryzae]|uniref:Phosphoesterase n=1 Tax=Gracilibacillus oryzae TaxID=1672701 RepID=A0A7C8KPW4_9BACI|nr:metallophosphoesterase [Gracilibacillus oryzae]KAB8134696.1 metallophosphoesterase [Gracilibacillus oryzae]
MPKVLIMSDSHGWEKEVIEIKNRHQNEVDAIIHCGDSELLHTSEELAGMRVVRGNMDMDDNLPEEADFTVDHLHFFVAHGHMHQIKFTLQPISYRADEVGANVICFGHSHIAGAEKAENKLFINPGSIRLPRSQHPGSYAILTANQDLSEVAVDFYTKEGQEISALAYRTSLKTQ